MRPQVVAIQTLARLITIPTIQAITEVIVLMVLIAMLIEAPDTTALPIVVMEVDIILGTVATIMGTTVTTKIISNIAGTTGM